MNPIASGATLAILALAGGLAQAQTAAPQTRGIDFTIKSDVHDVSPPLRDMKIIPVSTERKGRPVREHWIPIEEQPELDLDPLVERGSRLRAQGPLELAPTVGTSVDGLGIGTPGFSVNSAPPDTTGAVGATQFVQWVNTSFAVYDKATKTKTFGPANGLTLWSGFAGVCGTRNDGDPIVQYDKIANRWVLSQFAVPSAGPFTQCIAVSTTSDATGSYNRYQFTYPAFNDFPKVGVWPDAYYVTYNIFTSTFQGSTVCAIDRAKMLAGQAATQQCFNLAPSFGSTLPGDLDGPPPAAGTPATIVARGTNSINFWKFRVNWTTPSSTTLTGPVNVPVAAFSPACSGGNNCIPQPNTRNRLDSLADRMNFRAAYRADRDSMTLTHPVSAGSRRLSVTALRWHEFRNVSAATPTLAQEGTFGGTDGVHRWMGSIAQDKFGNIAIGYTASSASVFPSVRFASRSAGDAAGTLGNETVLATGAGSQTGGLTRWGDYSHTSLDPADDCTFWHTNEYLTQTGSFNWNTRISSFKLPGCP